jgi:hypothetical protein
LSQWPRWECHKVSKVVVTLLAILRLIILGPRRIFEMSQSAVIGSREKKRSSRLSLAFKLSFDKTDNVGKHKDMISRKKFPPITSISAVAGILFKINYPM